MPCYRIGIDPDRTRGTVLTLHSGAPYWLLRNGLPNKIAHLASDTSAEVVVVGGGITGALVADALTRSGIDELLLDARACGAGSTSASAALLQYEIDRSLTDLSSQLGEARAVQAYRCSVQAIDRTAVLVASLDDSSAFAMRQSIYLPSKARHLGQLEAEVTLRQRHGVPAEFWSAARVKARYGFPSHGAIEGATRGDRDRLRIAPRHRSALRRAQ